MVKKVVLVVGLVSGVLVTVALADKAPLPPEELRQSATPIVVGKVDAIYQKEETAKGGRYTRFVAEITVVGIEKGEGVKKGELLYARYWTRKWARPGFPPPSTNGHRGLPVEGQTLRIYLARNAYDGFTHDNKDGGFNVIGANGFEPMKKPDKPGGAPGKPHD